MDNETPQDAITEDEISGKALSASSSASSATPRNAFTALMSPKPKVSPESKKLPHAPNPAFDRRSGLGAYIEKPEKYDSSRVIFYNDNFVAIHDLYPKSSIHTLLLPRSPKFTLMHPIDAFEDADFLTSVRTEAAKLKSLVAKELQLKYSRFSAQEVSREKVLNGEVDLADDESLPEGRDWAKEVRVGIHAHPSMNHLHVHVMSVDRYSECMRPRKHYNSFATPFFIELEAFPLGEEDVRRHPGREGYLKRELVCWRCGKGFGNKFARLKEHLAEEFEEWKRE